MSTLGRKGRTCSQCDGHGWITTEVTRSNGTQGRAMTVVEASECPACQAERRNVVPIRRDLA